MIRVRTSLVCLAMLVLPVFASAQVRFYGTLACNEPAAQSDSGPKQAAGKKAANGKNGSRNQRSAAGDKAADAPKIASSAAAAVVENCSWSLPLQIGVDTAHEGQNTITSSVAGGESKETGSHISHMTNSDQLTMTLVGTAVLNGNGEARSRQGTWTFTNGTGALKGISGKGTYSGVARAAGGMSYDIEGAYELPASPAGTSPAGSSPAADPSSPKPASQS